MFITTALDVEDHDIVEYKGMVRGIIVRAPTIAQGIVGPSVVSSGSNDGPKNLIGGEAGAYTQTCEQARQQAYELFMQHAQELGVNAIVELRYGASEVVSKGSATEVLCSGSAVAVQPDSAA